MITSMIPSIHIIILEGTSINELRYVYRVQRVEQPQDYCTVPNPISSKCSSVRETKFCIFQQQMSAMYSAYKEDHRCMMSNFNIRQPRIPPFTNQTLQRRQRRGRHSRCTWRPNYGTQPSWRPNRTPVVRNTRDHSRCSESIVCSNIIVVVSSVDSDSDYW